MVDLVPAKLQLVKAVPRGRDWLYEPKFDGYRGLIGRPNANRVIVLSRNGKDLGRFFPELILLAEGLPAGTVIDGEIVSPTDDGVSFTALQRRLMLPLVDRAREGSQQPVAFVGFDMLMDQSEDVRRDLLHHRRARLETLVKRMDASALQLISQTSDAEIAALWLEDGVMAGIEGVVAKRDEPYPKPNVRRWQKVRRLATMDVLVHGFAGEPTSPRLVVAVQDGTEIRVIGTTLAIGAEDAAVLAPLIPLAVQADRPVWAPFDGDRHDEWFVLPPGLVAEIAYSHLDNGTLRQAARFSRWRFSEPE